MPEGGGVRGRPPHRGRRGAGRRGGRPGGPEPDHHPGAHRGCRRRRAMGRAPLVRPGRLRPGQPVLPRLGSDHPRRGRRPRRGCKSGSTTSTAARPTSRSSARSGSRRCGRAPPRRAASTTGITGERAAHDPGRRSVPIRDRWRSGPDPGQRRRDDPGLARALPPRPPAGDGGVVRAAAHRAGAARRCRRRPVRRRSSIRSPNGSWPAAMPACGSADPRTARTGWSRSPGDSARRSSPDIEDVP